MISNQRDGSLVSFHPQPAAAGVPGQASTARYEAAVQRMSGRMEHLLLQCQDYYDHVYTTVLVPLTQAAAEVGAECRRRYGGVRQEPPLSSVDAIDRAMKLSGRDFIALGQAIERHEGCSFYDVNNYYHYILPNANAIPPYYYLPFTGYKQRQQQVEEHSTNKGPLLLQYVVFPNTAPFAVYIYRAIAMLRRLKILKKFIQDILDILTTTAVELRRRRIRNAAECGVALPGHASVATQRPPSDLFITTQHVPTLHQLLCVKDNLLRIFTKLAGLSATVPPPPAPGHPMPRRAGIELNELLTRLHRAADAAITSTRRRLTDVVSRHEDAAIRRLETTWSTIAQSAGHYGSREDYLAHPGRPSSNATPSPAFATKYRALIDGIKQEQRKRLIAEMVQVALARQWQRLRSVNRVGQDTEPTGTKAPIASRGDIINELEAVAKAHNSRDGANTAFAVTLQEQALLKDLPPLVTYRSMGGYAGDDKKENTLPSTSEVEDYMQRLCRKISTLAAQCHQRREEILKIAAIAASKRAQRNTSTSKE